jgi:hypothetical protein
VEPPSEVTVEVGAEDLLRKMPESGVALGVSVAIRRKGGFFLLCLEYDREGRFLALIAYNATPPTIT